MIFQARKEWEESYGDFLIKGRKRVDKSPTRSRAPTETMKERLDSILREWCFLRFRTRGSVIDQERTRAKTATSPEKCDEIEHHYETEPNSSLR